MSLFLSAGGLRQALRLPSAWILIAANLCMIAGVVFWQWSVFEIVFLYWVENLAVGLINVLRMAVATGEKLPTAHGSKRMRQWQASQDNRVYKPGVLKDNAFKFFLIPFFIVHYGMFCYGHGVFVLSMFGDESIRNRAFSPFNFYEFLSPALMLAVAALAVSHLFSFINNFLVGGEYQRTHAAILMMRPYGRIVALHITILLGALLIQVFGSPLALLVVLVIMKTMADLVLHESERRKLGVESI